jgi:hypothetical protein
LAFGISPCQLVTLLRSANLSLPARPGLLLLTGLLFLGFFAIQGIWDTRPRPGSAGFILLGDFSSNNLNSTSAEAPESQSTKAAQTDLDQVSFETAEATGPVLVSVETQERPPELAPGGSVPILLVAEKELAREPCYVIRDPHRGDTPMKRTWKLLAMNTLVAALVISPPSLGHLAGSSSDVNSDVQKPTSESKKLDEIQRQLDDLKKDVKNAATALAAIGQDLKDHRTDEALKDQSRLNRINELKDEIARLRTEVDSLQRGATSLTREAGSPPTEAATATGRVEMFNTYPAEVAIVVNRRTYRVPSGERRLSEPIPAGTFTYEVLNYSSQKNRTLAANKVFTIWVHPQ